MKQKRSLSSIIACVALCSASLWCFGPYKDEFWWGLGKSERLTRVSDSPVRYVKLSAELSRRRFMSQTLDIDVLQLFRL